MNYKSKILIVDDEALGRDVLEGLLSNEGYKLIFAENGFEAIDKSLEYLPDLILLDIMMPGIDGFEVCSRIRGNTLTNAIPILMITALDDKDSLIRGIDVGADDFISKPFDRIVLRQRVKTIIKLNRFSKLIEEKEKFEEVIRLSGDGFIIIDKTGKPLYLNSKAKTLLALPEDHNNYSSFNFFDKLREQYRLLNDDLFSGWPDIYPELPIMAVSNNFANYSEFWIKITILKKILVSEEYIIKLSDVTQEIVNNRDVWIFHNSISHKLRTPFNSILGGLVLLQQNLTDLNEYQNEMLNLALTGAKRYFDNISNILDLLTNLNNKRLSGYTTISQLTTIIEPIITETKIEKFEIAPLTIIGEIKLNIPIDIIELILYKLFDNSRKFHPVNDPAIKINIAQTNNNVIISISDDGVKLTAEEHLKIWAPYYQAEKIITGEVEGSGLGLSYIAQLMNKANGKYRSYNIENGDGITVELIIPIPTEN